MDAKQRQPIPLLDLHPEIAQLHALFDALAALDEATQTVLWRERFPLAEVALRPWAALHGRTIREHVGEAGYSLDIINPNFSNLVTVRLDGDDWPEQWAKRQVAKTPRTEIDESGMWSPAHGARQ